MLKMKPIMGDISQGQYIWMSACVLGKGVVKRVCVYIGGLLEEALQINTCARDI